MTLSRLASQWMDAQALMPATKRDAIDEATRAVMSILREHGFKAATDDRCAEMEAAITRYLSESNRE